MPAPISSARSSASAFSTRSPARLLQLTCLLSAGLLLGSCSDQPMAPAVSEGFALLIAGGNNQTGLAGAELPVPLKVRATRPNGTPISGIVVNFRVTSGGGSVYAGSAITNRDGYASDYWTLGPVTSVPQTLEVRAVTASGEKEVFGVFTATATPATALIGRTIVAAGYPASFACGLTKGGTAYCWGDNTNGQLGDGTIYGHALPKAVVGDLSFVTIAAGDRHTCGLSASGAAFCWGFNSVGQLGDGTTAERLVPTPVAGSQRFASLIAGGSFTCGLTVDGAAYCWGENNWGQSGDGGSIYHYIPSLAAGGMRFTSLTAGRAHTCGLTVRGAAYCWGWNGHLQLGDGTNRYYSLTPIPVAGGLNFTAISAGSHHTCGVTAGGTGYCWGWNSDGELGDSTTIDRASPTPIAGGLSFRAITAGGRHTCGIGSGGSGYCWGTNWYGEGARDPAWSGPIGVPAPMAGGLSFHAISGGDFSSCGVTTTGVGYCWGANLYGEVGDGTTTRRNVPTAVAGGLTFLLGS